MLLVFADLMSAEPQLTVAALGVHNSIIRKAQYANAGVVLEQEGDSYTVAFHKPLDAVSFCLQVGDSCWVLLLLLNAPQHHRGCCARSSP